MPKYINRLHVLRATKRLSQLDTAIACHIGRYRYWQIENGYEAPRPTEITALVKLFKVPVAEIFPEPQERAS